VARTKLVGCGVDCKFWQDAARFFARNTRFYMKLSVRVTRHPDIPFDHVTIATAILEHGNAMPAAVQAQLTAIFAQWLDEQMKANAQSSIAQLRESIGSIVGHAEALSFGRP
jgi:hypothetical protein